MADDIIACRVVVERAPRLTPELGEDGPPASSVQTVAEPGVRSRVQQ